MKCGSPGYIAPEIFTRRGYSYKADVFSLGTVFYNLISNSILFNGESKESVIDKNTDCDIE